MKVFKFGGTSVGSAENMNKVADIVLGEKDRKVVVLSAMSGTTNSLVEISELYKMHRNSEALEKIDDLEQRYEQVITDLNYSKDIQLEAQQFINDKFEFLREFSRNSSLSSIERTNIILAQGELISTQLFTWLISSKGEKVSLQPALDFMRTDRNAEPDTAYISLNLNQIFEEKPSCKTFVTQGFICLDDKGRVSNLERGGSDYSASLIGAAIDAEDIQIWTDIDGMHNNDPRFVEETHSIAQISFEEAAELAYFGAKILHPQSVFPAMEKNIPVWLKNTFKPEAHGTQITNEAPANRYTSVAAKDGIIAIRIKSYRMLMAYGFLKSIFEIFERHQTAIDMITTSEVAVSLTIDDDSKLSEILNELEQLGKVEVDYDQTIICIAGNFSQENKGVSAPILEALKDTSIRMISYGGSQHNVSVLIDSSEKQASLNSLNQLLF
ncbi:MAG: aspartate kinase [Flavobacteriaceae bacterium]